MSRNWRTALPTSSDSTLLPPIVAKDQQARPVLTERPAPQWEVELLPGRDLGFSKATGSIRVTPPEV